MASNEDIILHHYDSSPFSEKVRLVLGLKTITWHSVQIPVIMPRPFLMPMTGGYRRTPVMQIGADIFCDSQMIIRELDRRFPHPSLFPADNYGMPWGLGMWTDRVFFQSSVAIIFGENAGQVPADFVKDREALAGQAFNVEAMKQSVPAMRDQWRAYAAWLHAQLSNGRPFLACDEVSLADINAYMNIWFLKNGFPPATDILAEFPLVSGWADRIAALGHGTRIELEAKEALEIAKNDRPNTEPVEDAFDPNGRKPGDKVSIMPDDYGRTPVEGTIVSSSSQHIAIHRNDPDAGDVVVHFPRAGFFVMSA